MRFLSYSLIALIAGVYLAQVLREDTGYVLIGMGGVSVEMSFVMFSIIALVVIFISHYIIRTISGIGKSPVTLRKWNEKRLVNKASDELGKGLLAQKEGQWQKAERSLIARAEKSNQPVVNYLEAAKAATAQGASERAERYLRMAQTVAPKKDISVDATRIELLISEGRFLEASEQLDSLLKQHPKNTRLLELQAKTFRKTRQWQKLIDQLPRIRKLHVLDLDRYLELEKLSYQGLLNDALASKDSNRIRNTWSTLPKNMQHNVELIYLYCKGLIDLDESSTTEALLRTSIEEQWNDKLVYLYGLLKDVNTQKQIDTAERWLFNHENNATLLLTLGRLNVRKQLWGKARAYLESSLSVKSTPEACYEMAKLLEEIDEKDKAGEYYRQGLTLATGLQRNAAA